MAIASESNPSSSPNKLQTHISIDRASSSNVSDEKSPLLVPTSGNGNNDQDASANDAIQDHVNRRKHRQRIFFWLTIAMVVVVGGMAILLSKKHRQRQQVGGISDDEVEGPQPPQVVDEEVTTVTEESIQHMVHVTDSGEYTVQYSRNITSTDSFANLAQLMLPGWYEASVMAVATFDDTSDSASSSSSSSGSTIVDPSNIQKVRECLLTTRDLLDVFSPVYTARSFNPLRELYKDGYELVGKYQDLDHAKVTYDEELWNERRNDVLNWKRDFDQYHQSHNVLDFLMHPIQHGCDGRVGKRTNSRYHHLRKKDQSHLFWSSQGISLPCGDDLATSSLQSLAKVQLENSLNYLNEILPYDQVLDVEHQEVYHNFRKELRSFMDLDDLFGFVLMPQSDSKEWNDSMETLKKAKKLLGKMNDNWTAYDIYNNKKTTTRNNKRKQDQPQDPEQQIGDLESQIDTQWADFKEWAQKEDLAGTIQKLINGMGGGSPSSD